MRIRLEDKTKKTNKYLKTPTVTELVKMMSDWHTFFLYNLDCKSFRVLAVFIPYVFVYKDSDNNIWLALNAHAALWIVAMISSVKCTTSWHSFVYCLIDLALAIQAYGSTKVIFTLNLKVLKLRQLFGSHLQNHSVGWNLLWQYVYFLKSSRSEC